MCVCGGEFREGRNEWHTSDREGGENTGEVKRTGNEWLVCVDKTEILGINPM